MADETPISVKEATIRWKWRRRVSLVSFFAILIVLFLTVLGWVDLTGENVTIVRIILDSLTIIVLTWMGVAAVDDIAMKHIEKRIPTPTKPSENG